MTWDVEFTDEPQRAMANLKREEQVSIDGPVGFLEGRRPQLGYPHTSRIENQAIRICESCAFSTDPDICARTLCGIPILASIVRNS